MNSPDGSPFSHNFKLQKKNCNTLECEITSTCADRMTKNIRTWTLKHLRASSS